jgi:predicted secreted protein
MDSERLDAVAGEPMRLVLGATAATGYEWQVEAAPGVRVEHAPGAAPAGQPPGNAVTDEVLIVADAPGEYAVTARLVRPWQADQPIRERHLELVVRSAR